MVIVVWYIVVIQFFIKIVCFYCIVEQDIKNIQYLLFQMWIEQWSGNFDVIIDVMCYLVGRGELDLFIVIVFKIVDLVVFEEMVYNIDDVDIFVDIFQIWDQ